MFYDLISICFAEKTSMTKLIKATSMKKYYENVRYDIAVFFSFLIHNVYFTGCRISLPVHCDVIAFYPIVYSVQTLRAIPEWGCFKGIRGKIKN